MGTHRKCCCDPAQELDCPCPVYPTWCFGWQGYRTYVGSSSITQTTGRWTPLWYTSPYYDSRTSLSWQIGLTLYQFNGMKLEGTSVYQKPSPGAGVPGATYCAFNDPARTSVVDNPSASPDFPFMLPPKPTGTPPQGDNDWCIPYNYPAPEWVGVGGRPGNNQNEVTIIWPITNAEQPQSIGDWDYNPPRNQYCCSDFIIDEQCTTAETEGFRNADKLCLGFEIQGNSALLEEMWSGLSGIGFGTNGVIGTMLGNATSTGRWAKRVYSENGGALKALRFFADPNVWGYNVPTTTSGGRGVQGPLRLMDGAAMRPNAAWNNHRAIFTHTNWGRENGIDPILRNCYCNSSWPETGSCTTQEISVSFNISYLCGESGSITAKWPVPLTGYARGTGCRYSNNKVNLYTTYENPEPLLSARVFQATSFTQAYCDDSGQCETIRPQGQCSGSVDVFSGACQARVGCRGLYEFQNGSTEPCDGFAVVYFNSETFVFGECGCENTVVDCDSCSLPCPPDSGVQCSIETADGGSDEPVGLGGLGGGGPGGFGCGGPGEPPCTCPDDPFDGFPPGPCTCYDPFSGGQGPNTCCCAGYPSLAALYNCYDENGQVYAGANPTCACIAQYCANWPDCGPICGYCPACPACCGQEAILAGGVLILFDIRQSGAGPKLSQMTPYNIRAYAASTEEPINLTGVSILFTDQPNYVDPNNGQLYDFGCFDPVPVNGGVGCFTTNPFDFSYPASYCNYPATNPNYRNQ